MRKTFVIVLLTLAVAVLPAQNFTRVLQFQQNRMNGADVTSLQRRFTLLGIKKVGPIDGWFGPLTEGAVKTAQYYMGFPNDGKVTKAFWDMLFSDNSEGWLKDISFISNFNAASFVETTKRNGDDKNFDEFVVTATQNKEVKKLVYRQVNDGNVVFRFTLWYLPDAVFIVQEVYNGDNNRAVYLKTDKNLFVLKNGSLSPVSLPLESILNKANDGVNAEGFTVPALVPATLPE
jgi:peptidoglycan hydrolase-like protein with peptidoglycan-binding domain